MQYMLALSFLSTFTVSSAVLRKHRLSRGLQGIPTNPSFLPREDFSQDTSQAAARFPENLPADVNTSPGKSAAWPLTRRKGAEPSAGRQSRREQPGRWVGRRRAVWGVSWCHLGGFSSSFSSSSSSSSQYVTLFSPHLQQRRLCSATDTDVTVMQTELTNGGSPAPSQAAPAGTWSLSSLRGMTMWRRDVEHHSKNGPHQMGDHCIFCAVLERRSFLSVLAPGLAWFWMSSVLTRGLFTWWEIRSF